MVLKAQLIPEIPYLGYCEKVISKWTNAQGHLARGSWGVGEQCLNGR